MKKIRVFLCIGILFVLLTGCAGQETQKGKDNQNADIAEKEPEKDSSIKEPIKAEKEPEKDSAIKEPVKADKETNKRFSNYRKLNIQNGRAVTSIGIAGDYYYYFENDLGRDTFYEYNLLTDEVRALGSTPVAELWLNSYAFLDRGIYYAVGEGREELSDMTAAHYKINVDTGGIELLQRDTDGTHPLVTTRKIDESHYLEYFSRQTEKGYEYYIRVCDTMGNKKDIVKRKWEDDQEKKEIIVRAASRGDVIYSCEICDQRAGGKHYYLRTYDLEGRQLSEERMPEVDQFMWHAKEGALWDFIVFQDYYYFITLSNQVLVLKNNNGKYEKVKALSEDGMQYVDALNRTDESSEEYLFYCWQNNSYYIFDAETGQLADLETDVAGWFGEYDNGKLVYKDKENDDVILVMF